MVDLKNMFRAIGHRNYRLFFFGQAISLCGTWMQTIAQQWLVFRLTDSAIALGAIGFCSQVPILLLVGLGGIVADRMDRHTIVVRTQIASMILATILAILTLTNTIHVWHVYVLSILLGIVNAFDMPARQSLITDLAGKKDMSNAIILNSGEVNAARLVGPAIGGILISIVGEGWCFAINAASYLAVIAGLLSMTVTHTPTKPDPTSVRQRLNEGFQFVNSHLPMRLLLYMVGLMSLLCCPHIVLMPIFATDILHGQSGTLGMLMAFSGAGAVIGALGLATKKTVRNLEYFIASAGLIAGIGFLVYGQSHWLWLTTLIMMPIGAATMMQLASSNTLIQSMVPDNLRGRVMSFHAMMFMGMAPVGSLLSGFCAKYFSAPLTVTGAGIILTIGTIYFIISLPKFRIAAAALQAESGRINQELAERKAQLSQE